MIYLKALIMIFIAEMGDKTQLLAMAFALRYKMRDILLGVAIGAFLNHGLAIALGALILKKVPMDYIQLGAGVMFLYFAFSSLKIEQEEVQEKSFKMAPFIGIAIAFFMGELGDKTQLAALSLSTTEAKPLIVLLGTTSGMVLTSLVGIIVGAKLGRKVPEDKLKLASFVMFLFFGIQKIYKPIYSEYGLTVTLAFLAIVAIVAYVLGARFIRRYAQISETGYAKMATKLHDLKLKASDSAMSMCLGIDRCGVCSGDKCLVGYLKLITASSEKMNESDMIVLSSLLNKDFNKQEARELLADIAEYYGSFEKEYEDNKLLERIRKVAEIIAFGAQIETDNVIEYNEKVRELING